MTLRPLRPLQADDEDDDNNAVRQALQAGPGPIASPAAPFQGKRATCSQCRVRKSLFNAKTPQVRCDGREGLCQNCARLGFECSFQQSPGKARGQYALRLPERRRRMQACIHCHLKKTRCGGELPSCANCVRKGRDCNYPPGRKLGALTHGRPSTVSEREVPAQQTVDNDDDDASSPSRDVGMAETTGAHLPDHATAVEQTEDYFRYLYPLPSFAFLHRPTVIRRCRDGTINEPLKLAICAITSLHLQRSLLCHDLWAQQAEQLILQQIGRPSIFHLQALLLIVRYRIESGEFPTAFMLAALAARTAVALRLNYERAELAFVAQEARRRLFWALYLLDDYFCVGLREFELYPEETIYLQLPCREDIFEAGQQCQTGALRPDSADNTMAMGLYCVFMRLASARRAIMRFNRRVGLGEESPSTIGDRIQRFAQDLAALYAALNPEDQYSVSNLISCKWQAQFVMLHTSYHQCHCDLFRMFLNGYSEAAPSGLLESIRPRDCTAMQAKCLDHAEKIIQILADFTNHGDGQCLLERDAAVCAFESARLVLFGARLSCAISALDVALHKAREISLHVIAKFFPYSASTRPLRTNLEHLISSYSVRLALQTRETLSEPEPVAPSPSSKVSQYANSRQRLSVQSLLLQSDFADDSHEIAGPLGATTGQETTTTRARPAAPDREEDHENPSRVPPPGVIPVAVSPGPAAPAPHGNTNPPQASSLDITTIDARREDAGLIFNPWMGFTGNEDFYELSEGLNEEY
ncbi:hypothetical protein F5Y19DRAFT_475049 [Xylariaceae sp. FL1651]|nr:hypothetical protein F5Y19DRAFT_475049 [Xylariaceae sp. FL1651]